MNACRLSILTFKEILDECHTVFPFSEFTHLHALDIWNTVKTIVYDQTVQLIEDVAGLLDMLECDMYQVISKEDAFHGEYAEL